MHNNEGKNPLKIIDDLDMTGYSETKKNKINDMRQEMEKVGLSQLLQNVFR